MLLLLGDTLYRSTSNKPCALQLIEAYERFNKLLVGLYPVPLAQVSHFGMMTGVWEDKDERVLHVNALVEKPKASYAEEFLGVKNKDDEREYCSVFGQYILTPEVFQQLAADIAAADAAGNMTKEIELTSALDAVRLRSGLIGLRLKGCASIWVTPMHWSKRCRNFRSGINKSAKILRFHHFCVPLHRLSENNIWERNADGTANLGSSLLNLTNRLCTGRTRENLFPPVN